MKKKMLHRQQKLVSAHISKVLRKQLNKRSMAVRKGDEVLVMRGKFTGITGKVIDVNLKKAVVYVDNVKRKKVSGKEVNIPLRPSKLMITNIVLEDPKRKEIVERAKIGEKA